jgi:transposase
VTRRQLTDDQWALIEPYLPVGRFGPYPERLREQFEGVIWRFRSSAQWREMPAEFGPWPTVYPPALPSPSSCTSTSGSAAASNSPCSPRN